MKYLWMLIGIVGIYYFIMGISYGVSFMGKLGKHNASIYIKQKEDENAED